jgi:hypothetical protein
MTIKDNAIATCVKIIGVLLIFGGVLAGLIYGNSEEYSGLGDLQPIISWTIFANGLIWGFLLLGFSEVINLLQGIFNQGEKLETNNNVSIEKDKITNVKNTEVVNKEIGKDVVSKINVYYESKGIGILKIEATQVQVPVTPRYL